MATSDSQSCTLCLDQLTDPKTLPCLHSFCEKCLEPLVLTQEDGTGILGCPTCRYPVQLPKGGVKGLPTASGTFADLQPRDIRGERDRELANCLIHKQAMKLYCETCESVVCNTCAIDNHHDHDYYSMTSRYNQLLEQVQVEQETVKSKMKILSDHAHGIQARRVEIEGRGQTLIDEVHSLADRLIANIKNSEAILVSQLKETVQIKTTLLDQQKQLAHEALSEVKECHDSIEKQLQLKKPHLLFDKRKDLLADVREVKKIDVSDYEAAELNDVRFKGNGALLFHCKELGSVNASFVHQLCTPARGIKKTVQAGINTVFQFKVQYQDGTPANLPPNLFKCTLTPPGSATVTAHAVKRVTQGMYQANYTPVTSGTHRLIVEVAGREITNSPFDITVTPSIGMGNKTVHLIPKLQFPWGVALDKNGQLIAVTETGQHCVALFDREGQRVGTIGSKGKEDGKFTNPRGIAFTETNHILVSDYERIQKLNQSGHCIRALCGQGNGPLQFADPKGIAVHRATGKILVADSNNHRIQVLNPDLSYSHSFGKEGMGDGELQFPWDVDCDNQGNVYVADNENHAVQKFTFEGEFLLRFGGKGEGPGKLSWPSGVMVDSRDMVYVTDDNQAVSVFKSNGEFVERIKEKETNKNSTTSFKHPIGISVDGTGQLYVCDCWNSRVVILQ